MLQDLRIGEIARRTGHSIHTIRWYETQGLVPGVARDRGGRRRYSEYHVGWLDLMERLRCTGMSIAQMREYTALVKQGGAALKQRCALLARHQAHVRDTIARWTDALALIDAKVAFYDEWVVSGERPAIGPHQRIVRTNSAKATARARADQAPRRHGGG
jgi:DNA-binding transcriptional MerR regulator